MKAFRTIEGFVPISKGMLGLCCLTWLRVKQNPILVCNRRVSISKFLLNHVSPFFIFIAYLFFCGVPTIAQTTHFRVLNGVPHLPVFNNVAAANLAVGTPEAGMFIFNRDLLVPMYYNGSAWVDFCSVQTWTGGTNYFQIKKGVPFLPSLATVSGTPPAGVMYYSTTDASVMVSDGRNTFQKLRDMNTTTASYADSPGFSSSGSGIKTFRLPILMSVPTGIEPGAIYVDGASKFIKFYDGAAWKSLTCGFACGLPVVVDHKRANDVAPEDKLGVTYETVTNIPGEPTKCWITKNLGADNQAAAIDDDSEPSAGWYWQFNRKQGYKHDGTLRTPSTSWITTVVNSNWLATEDPCSLELKDGWRIPTYTEWLNVLSAQPWTTRIGPWASDLKLHAAGFLTGTAGVLSERRVSGYYASSTQYTNADLRTLYFSDVYCGPSVYEKQMGYSLRCIRDPHNAVGVPAQPGLINGSNLFCSDDCRDYTILPVPGATSYTWEYSGGGRHYVSSDGLTCTICPDIFGHIWSGYLTVVANNASGSSTASSFYISVNIYKISYGGVYQTYICKDFDWNPKTVVPNQKKNVSFSLNNQYVGPSNGHFYAKRESSGVTTTDLIVDPATGQIDVTNSLPGSYTVCFDGDFGCTGCTGVIICEEPEPPVLAYSDSHVCKYPGVVLLPSTATPAGGRFTSDGGLSIDHSTGAINPSASSVGTHIITYTPNPTCCPDVKATTTVRIDELPSLSASVVREASCSNPTGDVSVTVDLHSPMPAPTAPSPQYFDDYYVRLYDLSVTTNLGCTLQWYDAPYGGNELPSSTDVISGRTYYVSQCYSDKRTPITVYRVDPPAVSPVPAPAAVYPPATPSSWTVYNVNGVAVASGSHTGDGTISVFGLDPGTYNCVVVNDETGCSASISITILPPADDCLQFTVIPNCTSGLSDVEICITDLVSDLSNLTGWTLEGSGPTSIPGYIFSSACITVPNLSPGTYTFTAKDPDGSPYSIEITIEEFCCPPTVTVTQIECSTMKGSVTICVNDYATSGLCDWDLTGTSPGPLLSQSHITEKCVTINDLGPGTYTFTVKDKNNPDCPPVTSTVTLNCPDNCRPAKPTYTIVRPTTCEDKTADITINGLPSSGNWTLNPGGVNNSGSSYQITNLAPGTYYYTVTDPSGCFSDTLKVTILCPEACTAEAPTFKVLRAPGCENKTADIVFELADGTWTVNPDKNVTSNAFYPIYGLAPGTYYYTFTNAEGCVSDTVTVVIDCPTGCNKEVQTTIVRNPDCKNKTADVRITGMPTGDWVVNPGGYPGNGTEDIIYNVPVGTYKFTITDQFGCTFDLDLVIECPPGCASGCEVPTFKTTVPDCTKKTFDLTIENLPSGEWTMEPGGYSGSGGTLNISGLIPGLTYTYILIDKDGYTAGYTVFVKPPCCPMTYTVQCIMAGHDMEKIWTDHSKVVISGLPAGGSTLTRISPTVGSPIAVSGVSHTFYGLANGTYTYRMTDQYGCVQEVTFIVDCHFASWNIIRDPECGGIPSTADLEFSNLPAAGWQIVPGEAGGSPTGTTPIDGTGATYQITGINPGDYTYTVYDGEHLLYSTLGVTIPYPGNGTIPTVSVDSFDPGENLATITLTNLPPNWTIHIGSGIEQSGSGEHYTFEDIHITAGDYAVTVSNEDTYCVSNPVTIALE